MSRKKVKDKLKKDKKIQDSIPDLPVSFAKAFDEEFISKGTGSRRKVKQKKTGSIPSRLKLIENVSESLNKAKKFNEKQANITKKAEGGLIGNQKKLDVDNSGTLTKKDFQMLGNKPTVNKKLGGSIQVSGSNFSGIY
jgi:hypothetical protein|tara:strand:+ start:152 stop:565 length:414 start_codon:yes stop_codon:yes gene_type:complete